MSADLFVTFLRDIGLDVEQAPLGDGTFLPGIRIDRGRLLFDPSQLTHPGDLLHEAGHLAVVPPDVRAVMSGDADGSVELAAIPWSYAAACAIGLGPRELFHEDGYRGRGEGLALTFSNGVYPGAHLLVAAGMCTSGQGAEDYPRMRRWLAH